MNRTHDAGLVVVVVVGGGCVVVVVVVVATGPVVVVVVGAVGGGDAVTDPVWAGDTGNGASGAPAPICSGSVTTWAEPVLRPPFTPALSGEDGDEDEGVVAAFGAPVDAVPAAPAVGADAGAVGVWTAVDASLGCGSDLGPPGDTATRIASSTATPARPATMPRRCERDGASPGPRGSGWANSASISAAADTSSPALLSPCSPIANPFLVRRHRRPFAPPRRI